MTGEVSPGGQNRPELRVSHEERDQVAEQLRIAAGDGRLTAQELDERLERALTARTGSELAVLVADLPAAQGAVPPEVKDLVRIECGSSSTERVGHWVVPRAFDVTVASGHVKLDFTEAVITQPVLRIDAKVRSGSLTLITRPGMTVDVDEVSVGSGSVKVRRPAATSGVGGEPTVLRIELSGSVRSGSIVVRPPRRGFWRWLLRRPHPGVSGD
ncbi:DUF1707 SHOCT-like domain-containing protein [Kitasatospora kifunensis]|uniref:DUF1707 domain-containing protein n=1 Tax=Kitasatospora kifunensis TaxID=58351 RepID=A0A7W7QX03_KITKI|nr:DUF1707 domain-containing protein [Kitasatospora kifunensis]MBB4921292.1 hypothetical protein [Kitasatospora kifunensis]